MSVVRLVMNNKKKETSPVCLNLHDEKNLHIVYITTGDNYQSGQGVPRQNLSFLPFLSSEHFVHQEVRSVIVNEFLSLHILPQCIF